VLRASNARMVVSLREQDEEIKGLKEAQRKSIGDDTQQKLAEEMVMEITSLKEQVRMLEQRMHIQTISEEHGYF